MVRKIREMRKENRFEVYSAASLGGMLLLHLAHWLSMPLLLGAAAEMKAHRHAMSGMGGGGTGFIVMNTIMLAVFIVNLIGMYYAVRQLSHAWKHRSGFSKHTCLCCALSAGVLGIGLYTTLTL